MIAPDDAPLAPDAAAAIGALLASLGAVRLRRRLTAGALSPAKRRQQERRRVWAVEQARDRLRAARMEGE